MAGSPPTHAAGRARAGSSPQALPPQSFAVSKRYTLIACILGSGIVFLDGSVVNVALPAIQRDLGASLASQQWIVAAYMLTLSSLLLTGGSLDDIFERRKVFATGVALFGSCSVLCAAAPSTPLLIAARALQGMAGAVLVPSTLAIITTTFPDAERGRAIGSWTAWTGLATVIGPLTGGVLIDALTWRLIFIINVPLVALTLALTLRHVPRSEPASSGRRLDLWGALLCALGLGGVVLALIEQPRAGWTDPLVVVTGLGGIAALLAFAAHERRVRDPMLPFDIFRSRNFTVGNATTFAMYGGLGGSIFFLGLFLQQVAGYSALAAGAAFLPITVLMLALSGRAGALADKLGPRLFMGAGPLLAAGGLALLLRLDARAAYLTQLLPGIVVFGAGLTLTVAPLTATVLGAADRDHAGIASGINNAIARVAGLIAIAAVGAVVAGHYTAIVDQRVALERPGGQVRDALIQARATALSTLSARELAPGPRRVVLTALDAASLSAFRLGLELTAGLVAIGGLISLAGISNPRRRVLAADCPGGALVGASRDLANTLGAPDGAPEPVPAIARAT